jgi:tetratricopeptide (TPR) repeat protein
MYSDALDILIRQSSLNPESAEPELADIYFSLGCLYADMQRAEDSEKAFRFALELYDKYENTVPTCAEGIANTLERLAELKEQSQQKYDKI